MATSSILGGTQLPEEVSGKDTDALGPSDTSDSGSDAQGAYGEGEMASDSDGVGTGERAMAGAGRDRLDADILPDHIERLGQGEDGGEPAEAARPALDLAAHDAEDDLEDEDLGDDADGSRA